MHALVIHAPLDLRIEDAPTPEPEANQLLVRIRAEFAVAVELLNKGLLDVKQLISDVFPYRESVRMFRTASDRSKPCATDWAP
ncbi:hypothetical protein LMG24076_04980 [Trinickia soli]|uniref:Uncharacterized protein n=1 Tax=Trinickia soli TaxID=380675 RepID=A0A2N7VJJ6_9BURK|nr:hypothetical protein C0Z19_24625 [Trinickia soli]CAB3725002.1 hypothetical protein LMG24076_04980 [Trinickia soli]